MMQELVLAINRILKMNEHSVSFSSDSLKFRAYQVKNKSGVEFLRIDIFKRD